MIMIPPASPRFPSTEHRETVRGKTHLLAGADRWDAHGYDYGWRRFYLDDFTPRSPIDRGGEYYDPDRAALAERMFRGPRPAPWSPPLGDDADPRYDRQWRVLAELRRYGGRPPEHSAEACAYVARCCQFVVENVDAWTAKNREALPPDLDPVEEERRALGIEVRAATWRAAAAE